MYSDEIERRLAFYTPIQIELVMNVDELICQVCVCFSFSSLLLLYISTWPNWPRETLEAVLYQTQLYKTER